MSTASTESWAARGACRTSGMPPSLWDDQLDAAARHTAEPALDRKVRLRLAKEICRTECPVMDVCRAEGEADDTATGVWGGVLIDQRSSRREWAK